MRTVSIILKHTQHMLAVVAVLSAQSQHVQAADELVSRPKECTFIAEAMERLACYDSSMRPSPEAYPKSDRASTASGTDADTLVIPGRREGRDREHIDFADRWELDDQYQRGTFSFRPHHETYLLPFNYNPRPNKARAYPLRSGSDFYRNLEQSEIKFQLSFKLKLLEDVALNNSDLWFGYTQESFWQAYSHDNSSPFRETDYQPELMWVIPTSFPVLGLQAKFINLGFVHQSNGQVHGLSRSWNRIYLQTGLQSGPVSVLARVWKRAGERSGPDDNPDITAYMGHGDIIARYRWRNHDFSLLARRNFSTDHGALQLSWAFPMVDGIKGYVQLFSGYGQSLIDYNHAQKTVGVGLMVGY